MKITQDLNDLNKFRESSNNTQLQTFLLPKEITKKKHICTLKKLVKPCKRKTKRETNI